MSVKRQADTELNKDNVDKLEEKEADSCRGETWKRAPDDVLATRKILKVSDSFSSSNANKDEKGKGCTSSNSSNGFAAYAKVNPFAAMGPPKGFSSSLNKPTLTCFASKTDKNADSVKSTSPRVNPYGATSPAHNPFINIGGDRKPNVDYWQKFKEPVKVAPSESSSNSDVKVTFVSPSGSLKSTLNSFSKSNDLNNSGDNCSSKSTKIEKSNKESAVSTAGPTTACDIDDVESKDNNAASKISEKKPPIATAAMFQKPVELDNGEAGEDCVLKIRSKLYRLAEVDAETSSSTAKEWVEVGTGPVRLLTPAHKSTQDSNSDRSFPRVVMRREHEAGGQGTKVILNASFRSHFSVTKMGERAARLTCLSAPIESSKGGALDDDDVPFSSQEENKVDIKEVKPVAVPMTFLFKMQHGHEADQFVEHVTGFLKYKKEKDGQANEASQLT